MPTFDTPEPVSVTIELSIGGVWIKAGDRADTVVDVRPTDPSDEADGQAAAQTQVEYAGGRLLVRAPKNRARSLFRRPGSIDVTIDLPSGSLVDATIAAAFRSEGRLGETKIKTAVGSVRLDRTGRLRVSSGAGDISVAEAAGQTEVTTASGAIRIGRIGGPAVVKSANGNITLGDVTGDVRVNTASGDIAVDRAHENVAAKTAYGSVRVGEVTRGTAVLETAYGEVEIGVRAGTAAWLDVVSQFGSVRNLMDSTEGPETSDEVVEVRARTGFGDILIRRSASE